MAARTAAAAHNSLFRCLFLYLILVCLCFGTKCFCYTRYTCQELVDIGYRHKITVSKDFCFKHNIPDELARPLGALWIVVGSGKRRRRKRERKQMRGRRSGLLLKLKNNPQKIPLPSLYLTNARSITHKTDDLKLQLAGNRFVRDCCVLIITETWLNPRIPDASVQLAGRSLHRWDWTEKSDSIIGSVLCGVVVFFIITIICCNLFKIEIVLWFRRAFPVLYTNKDLDGKLYDAYVAYPQPCDYGFSKEVEKFALQTLPEVLEKACDYKLFIAGRDCLPGQAVVDSVEGNIQASRQLLLLYTASTFTTKRHTSSTSSNNNNVSKLDECSDTSETKAIDNCINTGFDRHDNVFPDTRHRLEFVAGMHRALLQESLKVVLVELEEITTAQLALFPDSVRHLRKKQGAVCLWKKSWRTSQRWKTCVRGSEDEEKGGMDSQLSLSLSPSSRFWKELRYHMPVRGKRVVYPEKTALLKF